MEASTHKLIINRHDFSADKSLRAHSAADEYLLNHIDNLDLKPQSIAVYNDRFGYLSCHLNKLQPTVIITNKSQKKAILLNHENNNLNLPVLNDPLSALENNVEYVLMKAPKSLEMFHLFLEHISFNSSSELTVVIGFMTRHFSPKLLTISEKYFEDVKQSRAVKKARLLILSNKKTVQKAATINTLSFDDQEYKQHWGVFSAKHIDYATQYFLKNLKLNSTDKRILDLASGNGIIAKTIHSKLPEAELHLMDDSFLAVESAKLNLKGKNIFHHFNNDLSIFDDSTFDLIVTNPPFHFEYEVNIQIAIRLFKECFRCLKLDGRLQIVASKHLNYRTHLKSIFPSITVLNENDKFIIYKCVKTISLQSKF